MSDNLILINVLAIAASSFAAGVVQSMAGKILNLGAAAFNIYIVSRYILEHMPK